MKSLVGVRSNQRMCVSMFLYLCVSLYVCSVKISKKRLTSLLKMTLAIFRGPRSKEVAHRSNQAELLIQLIFVTPDYIKSGDPDECEVWAIT